MTLEIHETAPLPMTLNNLQGSKTLNAVLYKFRSTWPLLPTRDTLAMAVNYCCHFDGERVNITVIVESTADQRPVSPDFLLLCS